MLVLTTDTLVADMPEHFDPTAGPATGGGAELLGRA
jgi:chaperonin GroEL